MINPLELRQHVIEPTLQRLAEYDKRMDTPAAVNLLLGTAAHESLCGYHLKQVQGPALGIYQMEPDTFKDIWKSYIIPRTVLDEIVSRIEPFWPQPDRIIGNLYFATAMARIHYWRRPEPLPDKDDIEGQAKYWKKHYNTSAGKGSIDAYLENANNVLDAML